MLFFIIVLTSLVIPTPTSDTLGQLQKQCSAYHGLHFVRLFLRHSNDAPASISVITAGVLFWWNILHLMFLNLWPRNWVRGLNASLPGSIMADSLQVFSWVLKGRISKMCQTTCESRPLCEVKFIKNVWTGPNRAESLWQTALICKTESDIRTSSPPRVGRKRYKDQEEQNPRGNVKGTIHEWKNCSTHRSLCYKHEHTHTHTPTSSCAANSKRALLIRRNVTSGVPWAQIFYFINRLYSRSARRTPLDHNKSNCLDNSFILLLIRNQKPWKAELQAAECVWDVRPSH